MRCPFVEVTPPTINRQDARQEHRRCGLARARRDHQLDNWAAGRRLRRERTAWHGGTNPSLTQRRSHQRHAVLGCSRFSLVCVVLGVLLDPCVGPRLFFGPQREFSLLFDLGVVLVSFSMFLVIIRQERDADVWSKAAVAGAM